MPYRDPEKKRAAAKKSWLKHRERVAVLRQRYASNAEHYKAQARQWRRSNPERERAAQRAWKLANPDWHREWVAANRKQAVRLESARQLRKYGITAEDYARALETQNHCCALCVRPLTPGQGTHVDHCHSTRKFRGLLCGGCNRALGHFHENAEAMERAAAYIRAHQ